MTSDNHDFAEAVEIVGAIMKLAGDPAVREKLRKLQAAAKRAMQEQSEGERHSDKEPTKGTCPTCGKTYSLKKDGSLRRHGKGKCFSDKQLPKEIIPAVLAIAQLGNHGTEDDNGSGTQDNTDH